MFGDCLNAKGLSSVVAGIDDRDSELVCFNSGMMRAFADDESIYAQTECLLQRL